MPLYKTEGALRDGDSRLYVPRDADRELVRRLQLRDYVMLSEPSLQGKTSLLYAAMEAPALYHMDLVYVDLADERLGRESEASWRSGVCGLIRAKLSEDRTSLARVPEIGQQWVEYLQELADAAWQTGRPLAILCDNVGQSGIPDEPDFFVAMRSVYSRRLSHHAFTCLSFVLAGRFNPTDLIPDKRNSPFNIAHRLGLDDFSADQVLQLVVLGPWAREKAAALAQQVHWWTNGHPYLTQLLCSQLDTDSTPQDVDRLVRQLPFSDERHLKPILRELREDRQLFEYLERIYRSESAPAERVQFYPEQIRRQFRLELLGMIREDNLGYCRLRSHLHALLYTHLLDGAGKSSLHAKPPPPSPPVPETAVAMSPSGPRPSPAYSGHPSIKVNILSGTFPTALCAYLTAKSFPFVTIEVAAGRMTAPNVVICATVVIEDHSAREVRTFPLAAAELAEISFLPLLRAGAAANIRSVQPANLLVRVEELLPTYTLLHESTERIHLQANDTALLGIRAPDGSIIDLTDYLAAWVTPRNAIVQEHLRSAANGHPDHRFVGYQGEGATDQKAIVRQQAQAIYDMLKLGVELDYIDASLSLGVAHDHISQRVSLPEESLKLRSANCLDGVVLFASLLLAASIQPVLALAPGHAFVGWRIGSESEEYEFLDTTDMRNTDFGGALAKGRAHYDSARAAGYFDRELFDLRGFAKLIDVWACHNRGIYPLAI